MSLQAEVSGFSVGLKKKFKPHRVARTSAHLHAPARAVVNSTNIITDSCDRRSPVEERPNTSMSEHVQGDAYHRISCRLLSMQQQPRRTGAKFAPGMIIF